MCRWPILAMGMILKVCVIELFKICNLCEDHVCVNIKRTMAVQQNIFDIMIVSDEPCDF
jgi:hypothetical protein